MAADETHEQAAADDDGVELPADEPGATDEPGPSDDEQAAEAEEEEPTPEPEPEPVAQGVTPEQWEARFKKIERSFNTYSRALEAQFEEAADDYCRCPMCLGDTPGFLNRAQAGRFPEEQADLVKHFLGLSRPVELQPDPETATCSTCGGEGKTLTGSKVPTQRERTCPTCKGYGYTPPPSARQNGAVEVVPGAPVGGSATPDVVQEERDEWGEPLTLPDGRENPNYGRMPHRKILVEPWGHTAGLSAQDAMTTAGS